jgi:hypothetical protein
MAQAILLEASLSFLGLGVTEPTPAWGLMLSGTSADFYQTAPWMILFPGLAITLAVFAFNLFGDSLRDLAGSEIEKLRCFPLSACGERELPHTHLLHLEHFHDASAPVRAVAHELPFAVAVGVAQLDALDQTQCPSLPL